MKNLESARVVVITVLQALVGTTVPDGIKYLSVRKPTEQESEYARELIEGIRLAKWSGKRSHAVEVILAAEKPLSEKQVRKRLQGQGIHITRQAVAAALRTGRIRRQIDRMRSADDDSIARWVYGPPLHPSAVNELDAADGKGEGRG